MLLNVSKVTEYSEPLSFDESFDLSDLQFGACFPVSEPVAARGTVRNSAGVLQLEGSLETVLHGRCDRCAASFTRPVSFPLYALLTEELEEEDDEEEWTFLLENHCADLDDIVRTTFILSMDTQLLCSEDCKGICCKCGKNLNDGPCDCQPESDPRFAVLRQLLKENQ